MRRSAQSRRRIVGQLLTESLLLALLGGVAGVALAALGLAGIKASGAASVPRLDDIGLDGAVLVYTLAVSVLSGLLFGVVPALRLTRASLYSTVKDGARRDSHRAAVSWSHWNSPYRWCCSSQRVCCCEALRTCWTCRLGSILPTR